MTWALDLGDGGRLDEGGVWCAVWWCAGIGWDGVAATRKTTTKTRLLGGFA